MTANFTNTNIKKRGNSEELIIFVHGYGPFAKRHLRAVTQAITGERDIDIPTRWDRVNAVLALLLVSLLCGVFVSIPFFVWSYMNLPQIFLTWMDQSGLSWLIGLAKFVGALVFMIIIGSLSLGAVLITGINYLLRESGSFKDGETDTEETYENDSLGGVVREVATERPDADLLVPFYDAAIFSNADVFLLASRLALQKHSCHQGQSITPSVPVTQ
jgi:hypothetical protein